MNNLIKLFKATLMLFMLLLGFNNIALAATLSPTTQTVIGTVNTALVSTSGFVATGFTGTINYTISPSLSAGLTLNKTTGVISGTPTAAKSATKYTITAKGATGSATTVVNITITSLTPTTQSINGYVGSAITATKSLTATNFSGAVTYTISPSLPAGLTMSATGVISGKPTVAQAATNYTITGKGAVSGTATTAVIITVLTPTITPASQTVSGTVGKAITATSSLRATGLSGAISYAISPTLPPAGLIFSTSNGVFSGTPTAAVSTVYTITGTGASGGTATAQINIGVVLPPPAISPATQTLTGIIGTAITPTQSFTATNFTGIVSYSITPSLPANLVMDSTTGIISGTPTATQAATTYTITATDSIGSAISSISITINNNPPNCSATPTPPLTPVEEGRRAYLRLNCYSCHGDAGLGGMGPNIVGEDGVAEVVPLGASSGMPGYNAYLCPNDITNLQAYLTALAKPGAPTFKHWWEQTPTQ